MLTAAAAVQAAVIAGVISVVIALLNNYFTRRLKVDEYKQKREELFLDRELKDAEEIVTFLDNASKELFDTYDEISTKLHNLWDSTYNPKDYTKEKIKATYEKLARLKMNHDVWFNYRARQLTSMFTEADKIYEEMIVMGEDVSSIYDEMIPMFSNVETLNEGRSEPLTQDFRREVGTTAQHYYKFRDRRLAKTANDLARYRKRLLSSLRASPFAKEKRENPLRQDDGVLVKGARWLQQWLRSWME